MKFERLFLLLCCLGTQELMWGAAKSEALKRAELELDLKQIAADRLVALSRARAAREEKESKAKNEFEAQPQGAQPHADEEANLSFRVLFGSPVAEHVKGKIGTISIEGNANGFDPMSRYNFNEVAAEKNDFVIVVVYGAEDRTQKVYEASSFVNFILANRQAKTVLMTPDNARLINSNLIFCIRYQKNESGQQQLTYICSWGDILSSVDDTREHANKRDSLLRANDGLLLTQLGEQNLRQIMQQTIGGSVMRSQQAGSLLHFAQAQQDWTPLTPRQYVKGFIGVGILCFLQGFLNNWNARRDGAGTANRPFYKASFGEFFRGCCALGVQSAFFPQASQSYWVNLFGAGAQVLGECIPFPGYPHLWRDPALTFRLFSSVLDTGLNVIAFFREQA